MVGGRQNFSLGQVDVLLAAGDDKDGLLPAHRGLDVSVGFGT